MAEGRDEEELEELDIQLGMVENPDDIALEALKAHQEAMGMRFENPDAPVMPSGTGLGGFP